MPIPSLKVVGSMLKLGAHPPRFVRIALAAMLGAMGAGLAGCDLLGGGSDPPVLSDFHATVPVDYVLHRSRVGDVSLRSPKTWRELSTSGVVGMYLKTDRKGSSVSLVIAPKTSGETLSATMTHLPEDLRHEFADFEMVKSDLVVINDIPAGRIIYEGSRGGFHGKLMAVLIDKGGKTYVLTYTASPDQFDEEIPAFESLLASIVLPADPRT